MSFAGGAGAFPFPPNNGGGKNLGRSPGKIKPGDPSSNGQRGSRASRSLRFETGNASGQDRVPGGRYKLDPVESLRSFREPGASTSNPMAGQRAFDKLGMSLKGASDAPAGGRTPAAEISKAPAANWPFKAPVASSGPPPRAGNIQNSPAPRLANTFSQYKPAPNEYRPVGRWPYNYASALRADVPGPTPTANAAARGGFDAAAASKLNPFTIRNGRAPPTGGGGPVAVRGGSARANAGPVSNALQQRLYNLATGRGGSTAGATAARGTGGGARQPGASAARLRADAMRGAKMSGNQRAATNAAAGGGGGGGGGGRTAAPSRGGGSMKIKGKAPSSARRPSIVDAKNLEYSPGIAPVVLLAAAPALYYGAKSRQPLAVRAKPASKKKMKKQKEKEAAAAAAAAAAPARRKNPKDPKDDDGTAGVMSAVGGLFTVLGGAAALEYYRGEQRAARERARRAAEAEAISDDQCTSPFPIKPKKGGPAAPKATGATAAAPEGPPRDAKGMMSPTTATVAEIKGEVASLEIQERSLQSPVETTARQREKAREKELERRYKEKKKEYKKEMDDPAEAKAKAREDKARMEEELAADVERRRTEAREAREKVKFEIAEKEKQIAKAQSAKEARGGGGLGGGADAKLDKSKSTR